MSVVHADPEAVWSARLVHYADVPRRHVDLAEKAVRSVLDDTLTMSRELDGPPGWSVRKTGRSGRVFITVEEALNSGTAHLDSRIRGELAALREAAAQGMARTSGPSCEHAASCREVADEIVAEIEAGRFSADDYGYLVEDERRAAS